MKEIGLFTPLLHVIQGLRGLIIQERGTKTKLRNALDGLKWDLELMQTKIEKGEEQALQELAYEIEDFLYGLVIPGACRSFVLTALGLNPGVEHVERINLFKDKIKTLQGQESPSGVAGGATSGPSGSPAELRPRPPTFVFRAQAPVDRRQLVGITKPKSEILELLLPAPAGQHAPELRVISIVGCSGLGKTALARAAYDDPDVDKAFRCKAWVVASECSDADDLLKKILQQVRRTPPQDTSDITQLTKELRRFLQTRTRYLVVVDDIVKAELWGEIEPVFLNDDTSGSRIIVTTSIQPIATRIATFHRPAHSPGSYRYTMRGLDIHDSKELFLRKIYGSSRATRPQTMVDASGSILSKCDGLPLALVSVAKYLESDRSVENCRNIGQTLGTRLEENAFGLGELKRALVQCYDSLPAYRLRRCLLSVSMFPQGHQIDRKSLLRRWIAEGLIFGEGQRDDVDAASNSFSEFVDHSIIDPVLIGNNSEVKRCQVQGTMLEFIVHRSINTANFVTLIHKDEHLPKRRTGGYPVRRLSVHDGTEGSRRFAKETDLSVIRWLTMFKCNSVLFSISTCKLLRVLDLEDCRGLDDKVLANICELVFLKYLSLRGSDVNTIPMKITELKNLETLDIRKTKVNKLPMVVIMMPGLAHLFGRFELIPHEHKCTYGTLLHNPRGIDPEMKRFLLKESNLQTLAGVVISNEDQCTRQIILHAANLKEVKLFCVTKSSYTLPLNRVTATSEALDSLSVDSTHLSRKFLSENFLSSIDGYCPIKSIKLRGVLGSLPSSEKLSTKLTKLEELQLFSTGLSSQALCDGLKGLPYLRYLKLAEDRHEFGTGSFVVGKEGFQCLERLCFKAPKLPEVQFEQGSMGALTSLQLLCPEPSRPLQFCVEGISRLQKLNEVILHHSATEQKILSWKEVAKRHINRPCVKKQPAKPISNTA